jgi:hypothetical protein
MALISPDAALCLLRKRAQPIKSVVMYATGDSVVAGLVPATSRRCCGRVSICEISVSADVWEKCHTA